ncbi:MAG: MFS transporter [Micromonosporaceae bacterium]
MQLAPYRRVLALPGVKPLLLLSVFARVPALAGGMVLTLHVVLDLRMGFGAAGAVFAASILGRAVGGPVLGRLTDRHGLRPMVVFGVATSAGFWGFAGLMNYPALLVMGFVCSVAAPPVFTISRQSIAALVPAEHRRPAYSLDSVGVELAYMTGPVLGVLVVTQSSTQLAIWGAGAGIVCSGLGFYWLNPPLKSRDEIAAEQAGAMSPRIRLRTWLRPELAAVLVATAAATVVLGASEVAMVALLKQAQELPWTSAVLIAWGAYSIAGGLVYGGLRRAPGPIPLVGLLGFFTIPLAFAGDWFWLAVLLLPAGLLCAPALASGADVISRGAPATARGEAMGYHNAAISVGLVIGTPAAGHVIDLVGPAWGFAAAGGAGVALASVALLVRRLEGSDRPEPTSSGPRAEQSAPLAGAAQPVGSADGIQL